MQFWGEKGSQKPEKAMKVCVLALTVIWIISAFLKKEGRPLVIVDMKS